MPRLARKLTVAESFSKKADVVFFHGDASVFISTIPDKAVSLIVTSPPYNIGKEYERKKQSTDDYLAVQARFIAQLYRILADDGSVCWQVGSTVSRGEVLPLDIAYHNIFKLMGFKLRNRIVWHYRHGLHATKKFSGRYETILWYTKSDHYQFNLDRVRIPARYPGKRYHKGPKKGLLSGNPLGVNPSDVWEIVSRDWKDAFWDIPNVKANHPEKTLQPCQFPVELVERCVLALTRKGEWVLDPYAGVGSALVGAVLHGRRAMGSERVGKYYREGKKRLARLSKEGLPLRPISRPVYLPKGSEKVAQVPAEWSKSKSKPRGS